MSARARSESGFTTIELLLAVMIGAIGMISLVGTFDVSRRVTSYSEMKEAAAHIGQQKLEELKALDYAKLALNGDPSPATSTDPNEPPHYLGTSGVEKTFRWNQKADAPAGNTEPLVIDATDGTVAATAEPWNDGRMRGNIYRYVTCVGATAAECEPGPETAAYKRITVAVTVDNALGPQKPIIFTTLVGNPTTANGEGENPLDSPDTECEQDDGTLVECVQGVEGTVRTWYLYDTPATAAAREEITASHPTHPTVAPSGDCGDAEEGDGDGGEGDGGCPVPDLMGLDAPPAPAVTPPLYNYSNEITGGSTPGGAVIRRDQECGSASLTTSDNTKGHLWVTAPLAAPATLTGDAALSVNTQTFNGVTGAGMICVAFYNVPGDITNMVANPPTQLGSSGYSLTSWPRSLAVLNFAMDFLDDDAGTAIPAGNRIGVRVWAAASSAADLVVAYDHPLYPSFVEINEAEE